MFRVVVGLGMTEEWGCPPNELPGLGDGSSGQRDTTPASKSRVAAGPLANDCEPWAERPLLSSSNPTGRRHRASVLPAPNQPIHHPHTIQGTKYCVVLLSRPKLFFSNIHYRVITRLRLQTMTTHCRRVRVEKAVPILKGLDKVDSSRRIDAAVAKLVVRENGRGRATARRSRHQSLDRGRRERRLGLIVREVRLNAQHESHDARDMR
jgi:hypothetical protein